MLETVEKVSVVKGVSLVELYERLKKERLERLQSVSKHVSFPRDPVDVELLAQEVGWCFECGGDLLRDPESLEYVCVGNQELSIKGCGLVWGGQLTDERIPFQDSDVDSGHSEGGTKPGTHLDFGGGLGSEVDRLAFSNILRGRKDQTGETYLCSRARMARVPLCHPLIKDLLSFGSQFCKKYELHQRNNGGHARFADQLGINLRLVGEHYVRGLSKLWADKWLVAASLFCLLYRESYPEKYAGLRRQENAEERFPELCLSDETLDYYGKLLQSCNPPILPQLPELKGYGDPTR